MKRRIFRFTPEEIEEVLKKAKVHAEARAYWEAEQEAIKLAERRSLTRDAFLRRKNAESKSWEDEARYILHWDFFDNALSLLRKDRIHMELALDRAKRCEAICIQAAEKTGMTVEQVWAFIVLMKETDLTSQQLAEWIRTPEEECEAFIARASREHKGYLLLSEKEESEAR